ncbi:hypothetical protein K438DRAFT_2026518 [Mycena galopus ATCC 62051]|nr:hypothetical protein K438DRAFT_2026518 [Mycena galopus ATCC 62051]
MSLEGSQSLVASVEIHLRFLLYLGLVSAPLAVHPTRYCAPTCPDRPKNYPAPQHAPRGLTHPPTPCGMHALPAPRTAVPLFDVPPCRSLPRLAPLITPACALRQAYLRAVRCSLWHPPYAAHLRAIRRHCADPAHTAPAWASKKFLGMPLMRHPLLLHQPSGRRPAPDAHRVPAWAPPGWPISVPYSNRFFGMLPSRRARARRLLLLRRPAPAAHYVPLLRLILWSMHARAAFLLGVFPYEWYVCPDSSVVQLLVTTVPTSTLHWIGVGLKRSMSLLWLNTVVSQGALSVLQGGGLAHVQPWYVTSLKVASRRLHRPGVLALAPPETKSTACIIPQ